ncbi:MAG TPA: DUF2306 domain-containing protein [Edaphobacter sp.]|jgi:uncharacterized membrane protein|nr:DUF2306 domain-containing protein [Edaphobacter sp.]
MTTSAVTPSPRSASPARRKNLAKPALWIAIGLAAISVLIFTEYPLVFHPDGYTRRLIVDRFFLIPHATAGLLAMLLGPFLFSTRFRSRHLKRHRIMGRVYVICITIAAPIAFYLEFRTTDGVMQFANGVMSVVWFLCTLAAFITARNRQLTAHRQWMTRSYVFTLNFLITRIPNPIPQYFNMSSTAFALNLLFLSICYLFFTDVYFNWRELTTSRKPSQP